MSPIVDIRLPESCGKRDRLGRDRAHDRKRPRQCGLCARYCRLSTPDRESGSALTFSYRRATIAQTRSRGSIPRRPGSKLGVNECLIQNCLSSVSSS